MSLGHRVVFLEDAPTEVRYEQYREDNPVYHRPSKSYPGTLCGDPKRKAMPMMQEDTALGRGALPCPECYDES
jgi:hypothetical protein